METVLRRYKSIEEYNAGIEPQEVTNFTVLYFNARSLKNKVEEIEILMALVRSDISMIVVTETWISEEEQKFYNFPGFNSIYASRQQRGGGCAIFIRDSIKFNPIKTLEKNGISYLLVHIERHNKYFAAIYNPKGTRDMVQKVIELLNEELYELRSKEVFIIGDLNINLLNENNETAIYRETCLSNGLRFCNSLIPTRNSQSLIDHVITNTNEQTSLSIIGSSLSDHDLQILSLPLPTEKFVYRTYQKKIVDCEAVKDSLKEFNNIYSDLISVSENYDTLINCFAVNTSYTEKTIRVRYDTKPWFNEEIQTAIKTRDYYFYKHRHFPDRTCLKEKYENQDKKVKSLIKSAQNQFYASQFSDTRGNSKKTWGVINSILYNKNKSGAAEIESIVTNNSVLMNPQDICEHMNSFFAGIGQELAGKLPHLPIDVSKEHHSNKTMFFRPVSEEEVEKVIESLDPMKATGADSVDVRSLKLCKQFIVPVLCKLINQSLYTGEVPEKMKVAKIRPLHKGGSKDSADNYRPISVLPSISKVFEIIVNNRLLSYLKSINFLYDHQYGFRESSDTVSATLDLVSELQLQLDQGKRMAVVSLDLRKAFDTVDHTILLQKMNLLGIRGQCYDWFRNYLVNRRQFVRINNTCSSEKNVNCGVPQGSILGPSLFLLYINSISCLSLDGKIKLYADDTVLVYTGNNSSTIKAQIQNDLTKLEQWLVTHKLTLNVKKSSYMFIQKHKNEDRSSIDFGTKKLEYSSTIKYLGLYLDETLSWQAHTEILRKKLSAPIGILKRLSYSVPKYLVRSLYFCLIHCHLQYLTVLWYPTFQNLVKPLKILQNKAIKNIYNLPIRYNTDMLYKNFNIMPLENIYKFQVSFYIHQIICKTRHSNLTLDLRSDIHNYNTRQSNYINLLRFSSTNGQNSIFYRGVTIYNNIPLEIRALDTNRFKLITKKLFR